MHNATQPHIIIVGAGLVGTSIALCFENQPATIEILENNLTSVSENAKNDSRPISLSYGSSLTLKKLGVWEQLADAACPIKVVHVSEQGRFGMTRITAESQKVPALGYVIPFGKLQSAIYEKALALPNVTMTPIETLHSITNNEDHISLIIDNNHNKDANLLIAADGTQSLCRQLLGIATSTEYNEDSALIFELDLSSPHNHTAYERFTKKGILAVLPLHNSCKARLVWSVNAKTKKIISTWNEEQLLSFLQDVFSGRLSITHLKKTAEFPLKTVIADTQIVNGAVLMGNAAHTIYPVAAQGFNLGLADVLALQDTLINALQKQTPLGSKIVLKEYVKKVTPHQEAIIKLTNQLTPLFELQLPFAGCIRGLGLLGLDLFDPLKSKLAKRAMGLTK